MAGADRATPDPVSLFGAIEDEPWNFGLFEALRLIECAHPDRPRLGESRRPVDDPVRLAQEPSLDFAPAALAALRFGAQGAPGRLAQNVFGLLGPNGPLPLSLTEYAWERLNRHRDPTLNRFLDVFHHRMLSLFYRAWADAEPTVNFDRPDADTFGTYVASLFGLGMESLRDRDAMPDLAKLHFAGRFALHTRPSEGLEAILGALFRVPAAVREFIGEWLHLPESDWCLLGRDPVTGTLGVSATIGARVWAVHQKFRLVLGPMSLEDYERLLPGGEDLVRLHAVVRNYVGDELTWDLNLVLVGSEVPRIELGRQGRLGWTTWLGDWNKNRDAGDLKLAPQARAA